MYCPDCALVELNTRQTFSAHIRTVLCSLGAAKDGHDLRGKGEEGEKERYSVPGQSVA